MNNVVDIGRLERILAFNSFSDSSFKPYIISGDPADSSRAEILKQPPTISVFYLCSFCNHSCVPNAHRAVFGDVMIVRALLSLSKGTEITLGYVPRNVSLEEREKKLERIFGFRCDCWYCKEEKMDGFAARRRRETVLEIDLSKAVVLARQATDKANGEGKYDTALFSAAFKAAESVKDKMEATYHPERGQFRPEMYSMLSLLTNLHGFKDMQESIEVFYAF